MSGRTAHCGDRERIFAQGTPLEWTALEAHALSCSDCASELRSWNALSLAAEGLRDHSENAALWTRIEAALREQAATKEARWAWLSGWRWQQAAAAALLVVVTSSAAWWYLGRGERPAPGVLLENRALREVEASEAAYIRAIDRIAGEARPELEKPATPLLASYREKLQVLDSAIRELRAESDGNPGNTQVRRQLLAMYQEKKLTLEEVLGQKALEEKR